MKGRRKYARKKATQSPDAGERNAQTRSRTQAAEHLALSGDVATHVDQYGAGAKYKRGAY